MKYTIIDGELYRTDELYHHGVKGMRWGVRRERKSRAERIKERTEARQARAEARKAKEKIKQDRITYKMQTEKMKTDLLNQTNQRLQADKTKRELSVKMTKQDRKKIAKLKGEQAVATAEADKLAAENKIRDEKQKAKSTVQKVLSKLGWATVDGVANGVKKAVGDAMSSLLGKGFSKLFDRMRDEPKKEQPKKEDKKQEPKKEDKPKKEKVKKEKSEKKEDKKEEEIKKEEIKEEPKALPAKSERLALPASTSKALAIVSNKNQSSNSQSTNDRYSGRTREEMIRAVREANEKTAAELRKRNENFNTASYNPPPAVVKKTEVLLLTMNPEKKNKK